MFGLFGSKNAPTNVYEGLLRGSYLQGDVFRMVMDRDAFEFRAGEFRLDRDQDRDHIRNIAENWIGQIFWSGRDAFDGIQRLDVELKKRSDDLIFCTASQVVLAIYRANVACKAALAYPSDRRVADIAKEICAMACEIAERVLNDRSKKLHELELTAGFFLLSKAPEVKAFMDKITGFR